MTRVNLSIYLHPSRVEAFINIKKTDGSYQRMVALVDTGAAISLLPRFLMAEVAYRLASENPITLEQAGIAQQSFQATEAYVTLFLEDAQGNESAPMEVLVWFAETDTRILGFEGVLDRATLYVDMRQTRSAYLEF